MLCRIGWLCKKLWDAIWVWKFTFWSRNLKFSRKISRNQLPKRWKISPRYYYYGKAVPRQMDLMYVGRLLLDTEEGCTWRQIPAKSHKPLHFRGTFLPVSLARNVLYCTFKILCIFQTQPDIKFFMYVYIYIYIYISEFNKKSTATFIHWSSWDRKKVKFCWPVFYMLITETCKW